MRQKFYRLILFIFGMLIPNSGGILGMQYCFMTSLWCWPRSSGLPCKLRRKKKYWENHHRVWDKFLLTMRNTSRLCGLFQSTEPTAYVLEQMPRAEDLRGVLKSALLSRRLGRHTQFSARPTTVYWVITATEDCHFMARQKGMWDIERIRAHGIPHTE